LKTGKILIIDGRLSSSDEALLIRETMNNINEEFNGVEIGVLRDNKEHGLLMRIKQGLARALIGDRTGITFIGPAKIISELRQHPENIELHFQKEYLLKNVQTKSAKPIIQKDSMSKKSKSKKSKIVKRKNK